MRFNAPRPRPAARQLAAAPRLPHPSWQPDFATADRSRNLSASEFWERLGD